MTLWPEVGGWGRGVLDQTRSGLGRREWSGRAECAQATECFVQLRRPAPTALQLEDQGSPAFRTASANPIILGAGERLLEVVGDPILKPVQAIASPAAPHIKYRIVR